MTDSEKSVDWSPERTIYEVMAHDRRRRIIWCLLIADGWTLTIRQLASHIVAFEQDAIPVEMSRKDVTQMRTTLNRTHVLPLEQADIVTASGDTLQPGPRFFEVLLVVQICEVIEYNRQQSDSSD